VSLLQLAADARVPQVKVCDFGLARKKPDNMMTVDRELYALHRKSSLPLDAPARCSGIDMSPMCPTYFQVYAVVSGAGAAHVRECLLAQN
jgi:hypothetical protein